MSLLDELAEYMTSDNPCYHDFLLHYKPNSRVVYVFYEGDEDSSYYHLQIEKKLPKEFKIIEFVAGCKNNIIKLDREFDWSRFDESQFMFFVDRDLSDWVIDEYNQPSNRVYVTDGYSFESYLINRAIFEQLIQLQGFSRAMREEIKKICDVFDLSHVYFLNLMKPIMAMAIIGKRRNPDIVMEELKICRTLNINHDDAGDIAITLTLCESLKEKWEIEDVDSKDIQCVVDEINKNPHLYHVRGKWDLYFMVKLSDFIRENFPIYAPSLALGGRARLKQVCAIVTTKSAPLLAPRASYILPKSLGDYLDRKCAAYASKRMAGTA